MRNISSPFQRPGTTYPLFSAIHFLQVAPRAPLSAKADLLEAVRLEEVTFPHGVSDQRFYDSFLHDLWRDSSEVTPDIEACRTRYGKPSDVTVPTAAGFPYAFTLELLDRLALGEHPYFCSWALQELQRLFFEDANESDPDKALIQYKLLSPQ
jgi:hypothetical protein